MAKTHIEHETRKLGLAEGDDVADHAHDAHDGSLTRFVGFGNYAFTMGAANRRKGVHRNRKRAVHHGHNHVCVFAQDRADSEAVCVHVVSFLAFANAEFHNARSFFFFFDCFFLSFHLYFQRKT
jgi:hypothetical protein